MSLGCVHALRLVTTFPGSVFNPEAKEFAAGATECPRWYGLPWESNSDGSMSPVPLACRPSSNVTPGEVVLRTLLAEFTSRAAKKLEVVNSQPLVSN